MRLFISIIIISIINPLQAYHASVPVNQHAYKLAVPGSGVLLKPAQQQMPVRDSLWGYMPSISNSFSHEQKRLIHATVREIYEFFEPELSLPRLYVVKRNLKKLRILPYKSPANIVFSFFYGGLAFSSIAVLYFSGMYDLAFASLFFWTLMTLIAYRKKTGVFNTFLGLKNYVFCSHDNIDVARLRKNIMHSVCKPLWDPNAERYCPAVVNNAFMDTKFMDNWLNRVYEIDEGKILDIQDYTQVLSRIGRMQPGSKEMFKACELFCDTMQQFTMMNKQVACQLIVYMLKKVEGYDVARRFIVCVGDTNNIVDSLVWAFSYEKQWSYSSRPLPYISIPILVLGLAGFGLIIYLLYQSIFGGFSWPVVLFFLIPLMAYMLFPIIGYMARMSLNIQEICEAVEEGKSKAVAEYVIKNKKVFMTEGFRYVQKEDQRFIHALKILLAFAKDQSVDSWFNEHDLAALIDDIEVLLLSYQFGGTDLLPSPLKPEPMTGRSM
ncbi:MAG: hypothetical protein GF384_01960 [Elusimicrobia bacterium]|nr:hypothetical protein [Elusimicrobiota bacterium]MBD3411755.1 hypothetical protein [Elusimicrobiota bacterium]